MNANTALAMVMAFPVIVFAQSPDLVTRPNEMDLVQNTPSTTKPPIDKQPYDQSTLAGPHHRWRVYVEAVTNDFQNVSYRTNSYIEMASGLNYWHEGAWLESQEVIEKSEDGSVVAKKGLAKVKFAADVCMDGSVEIKSPDDSAKPLKHHLLGLIYYDSNSGQSAVIANVQSSIGEIISPNQILYRNVFKEVKADLRFTYTKSGLESDIIFLESLDPPGAYGLNEEDCKLQVFTEFLDSPSPKRIPHILKREKQDEKRSTMAEPDVVDETLDFGQMTMILGKCFSIKGAQTEMSSDKSGSAIPIAKRFTNVNGRDYLVESVEFARLKPFLKKLPRTTARFKQRPDKDVELALERLREMRVVSTSFAQTKLAHEPYQPSQGVVLDYIMVCSANNFTFNSGTTYFVSDVAVLDGTTTFQGGAIIKYNPEISGKNGVVLNGPVNCLANSNSYVHFTARDDNSLGATISGSTGTPVNYYGHAMVDIKSDNQSTELHHLHFKHGGRAAMYEGYYPALYSHLLRDCRFESCYTGVFVDCATVTVSDVNMCSCVIQFNPWSGSILSTNGITEDCYGLQVASPSIVPHGGRFAGSAQVILSTATTGATIRYTLDGTLPVVTSSAYGGPFSLTYSATVKARAFKSGMYDSGISTAVFTVDTGSTGISVAEGVDNTSLSWGTYGGADWFGQSWHHLSGGDAAESGEIGDGEFSHVYTTVYGPGQISFYWAVSSESGYDFLKFYADGVLQTQISGAVNWTPVCYNFFSSGSHSVAWEYQKDGSVSSGYDTGWLDLVQFIPFSGGVSTPLGQAVDNIIQTWATGGVVNWEGVTYHGFFENDSAKSGSIAHSQNSFLETTAIGPGNYSFYWKVSSEQGWDYLTFYIDGVSQQRISGESSWALVEGSFGSGVHTFKWDYSKDGSVSNGTDAGWVDYVKIVPEDIDNDGMPDPWEQQYFGSINQGPEIDFDSDGFINLQEYQNGTLPIAAELKALFSRPSIRTSVP